VHSSAQKEITVLPLKVDPLDPSLDDGKCVNVIAKH
jgi:hypothetical protein